MGVLNALNLETKLRSTARSSRTVCSHCHGGGFVEERRLGSNGDGLLHCADLHFQVDRLAVVDKQLDVFTDSRLETLCFGADGIGSRSEERNGIV
jgi:hypothetical protein